MVVLVHDANSMNYDDAIFPKITGHTFIRQSSNELEVSNFQLINSCCSMFTWVSILFSDLWTLIYRFWWTHFSNQASSNELEDFVAAWHRMHEP